MAETILSEATEEPIIVQYFKTISINTGEIILQLCQYLIGSTDNGSIAELKYTFNSSDICSPENSLPSEFLFNFCVYLFQMEFEIS